MAMGSRSVQFVVGAAVVFGVGVGASPCKYVVNGTEFASSKDLEKFVLDVDESKRSSSPYDWTAAYDGTLRPSVWASGGDDLAYSAPEAVSLFFELSAFDVDEKARTWLARGTLHVSWREPRLEYTTTGDCGVEAPVLVLHPATLARLWNPQLVFVNAVDFDAEAAVGFVLDGGVVWLTVRIPKAVFPLDLDVRDFPYDEHDAKIVVVSSTWDASRVAPAPWEERPVSLTDEILGQTVYHNLWQVLDSTVTSSVTSLRTIGHSRRELHYALKIKRRPAYYVSEGLFPALIFLLISWTAFFIDRTVAPARVTIAVIPVLIIRNLYNAFNSEMAHVSYGTFMTAILVSLEMLGACGVFQYGVVQVLLHQEKVRRERLKQRRARAEARPDSGCDSSVPERFFEGYLSLSLAGTAT